jgi:hypothetical protein
MRAIILTKPLALLGSVACLLLQVQAVSAGLITTEQALANFQFTGMAVDYDPAPPFFSALAASPASLPSLDPVSEANKSYVPPTGLEGSLRSPLFVDEGLGNFGKLSNVSFNLFGSVPPASSLSEIDLLKNALQSVRADHKSGGSVAFLAERDSVTGALANQYRSAGIFVLVNGVDEVDWINGFKDAEATAQLLSLEDDATERARQGRVPAVPLPGTLILLAGGLPLLWRVRRRPG